MKQERVNNIKEIKELLASKKDELQEKYKVKQLGIFGSYVRGEQGRSSDVDVLVEFSEPIGLFKFIELEEYLGKMLNRKVDLVTREALKPYIGKRILEEVRYL